MRLASDTAGSRADSLWPVCDGIDAVYFLVDPGWETEPPGNRWHYGRRFARTVPVHLLQPTLTASQLGPIVEPEPRIPGADIVRVRRIKRSSFSDAQASSAQAAAQIWDHMSLHGVKNPLFWIVTPWWGLVAEMLPAGCRVFHLCDDYWRISEYAETRASSLVPPLFRELLEHSARVSQVMLAVSDGVAAVARERVPNRPCVVSTNGCDFEVFANGTPAADIVERAAGRRVAVYGGKFGSNLNYRLLRRFAEQDRDTFLALFGRREPLATPEAEVEREELLAMENVHYFGELPQERLRDVYAASHLGLIPYLEVPHFVESGFAMKLLEYAAAGLPVVSTLMKPMLGLANALHICEGETAFLNTAAAVDVRKLAAAEKRGLTTAAQSRDYDKQFAQACADLRRVLASSPVRSAAFVSAWDDWWRRHPHADSTEFLTEAARRDPHPFLASELNRRAKARQSIRSIAKPKFRLRWRWHWGK